MSSKISNFIYIVILGMLCAFPPMCSDIYLPSLPDIAKSFQADPSLVQLSLTTSLLGLSLGQVIIGPLSDAYGRKGPLLVSLLIFTLTSFLCARSQDVYQLVAYRFFQGLAASGGVVLSRSIACDKFKGAALAQFMALLMTINSIAPILGPILGSFIVTFATWEYIFYFLTAWGLALTVLSLLAVPESHFPEAKDKHVLKAIGGMLSELTNLRFLAFVVSLSFVMGGFFSYLSASPFVFQVIYGYSPLQFSLGFRSIAAFISLCALIAGRLVRRMGEVAVVYYAYAFMAVAAGVILACAYFEPKSSIIIYIALMIFCGMMGAVNTAGFSIVMESRRGGAGAASGIFGVMTFVFGALTSPLMGIMGEHSMIPLGISIFACTILAIATFKIGLNIKS